MSRLKTFPALRHSGDKLWWADQGTDQIGICDKKDGGNWKVLRNSTSPMMHMKIYNETVQRGAGHFSFLVSPLVAPLFLQLKSPCQRNISQIRCVVVIATWSLFTRRTSARVSVSPPLILLRGCFCDPRHQSVQSQQWRLLPAVSAHLPDHQGLHVHGWIQPAHRPAVL